MIGTMSSILRRNEPTQRWFKKVMLVLLLALPLTVTPATSTQSTGDERIAAGSQKTTGFGLVSTQWCHFYPQLPFCPNSGTAVTGAPGSAPPGMGFVPISWCELVPTLPICETKPPVVKPPGDKITSPITPPKTQPEEVTGFGSNPGNLRMFKYIPEGLSASAPMVVALHGCAQQASSFDDETGWVKYADKFKFALLLPQETAHQVKCFRWFDPNHNERNKGEALSIKQMIDKMKADHPSIDSKRIYVTGLSAGGAMTAVMLATYPEIFAGGGIIAGIPYKCANSETEAQQKCGVLGNKPLSPEKKAITPAQWGDRVRNASGFAGPFPRVSIWHGNTDKTVNMDNEIELMEQWTDMHRIGQTPDVTETLNGSATHPVTHQVFRDAAGNALVETYLIKGMDHGTPVGPGPRDDQCGKAAPFILDVGLCSSFFIAKFWGLIPSQ